MKKIIFLSLILLSSTFTLFAQRNLSVELNNPVYQILDSIQVRGLCRDLPKTKPYSHAVIISALKEAINQDDKLYKMEKEILQHYIDDLSGELDYKWYQTGSYRYDSEKTDKKDAKKELTVPEDAEPRSIESENRPSKPEKEPVRVITEVGLNWWSEFNADAVSGDLGTNNYATAYVQGDISDYFSFYFDIAGGVVLHEPLAYQPFSYRKSWAGNAVPLGGAMNNNFHADPKTLSGVYNVNPELALSFWEDKVGVRFARIGRDWGYGDGGLMLSYDAVPFSAIDFYINPVEWFNVSVITGWLEAEVGGNEWTNPEVFQNMFAATAVEFFASKYAYISAFSSVVLLKRSEGMYSFPGTMGSVTQQTIGDFDNLQVGATVGAKYPGWFDLYLSMYFDEFSPTTGEAFLHKDRNMFSTQVGLNFEFPFIPFTSLGIQYTKIEPYMYTHPLVKSPYYSSLMSESYINAGQNLGYHLEPNSDELKITLNTQPFWFFNANLKYSMIRHGVDVDGSSLFGDSLVYANGLLTNPLYNKNFLKDGVYEWFHTIGFEAELDLRFIKPAIPIKLALGYHYVHKYHTSWEGGTIRDPEAGASETPSKIEGGNMIYINNNKYKDLNQHIFSISFKLF